MSLRRNAIYYASGQVAIAVFGFLVNVIIARWLPKEDFATYTYLIALAASFLPLLNFGTHNHYLIKASKERDAIDYYWARSIIVKTLLSPIVIIAFYIIYYLLHNRVTSVSIILVVYFLTQSAMLGTDIVFRAAERGLLWTVRRIVYEGSMIVMFIIAIRAFHVQNPAVLLALAAFASLLGAAWSIYSSVKTSRLHWSTIVTAWHKIFLYPEFKALLPFTILTLLWVLYYRIGVILLQHFSSSTALADFRVAFALITMIIFLLRPLNQAVLPRLAFYFANSQHDRFHRVLRTSGDLLLFSIGFVTVGSVLYGSDIIVLVFGDKYKLADALWLILAAALPFLIVRNLFVGVLNNLGHQRIMAMQLAIAFGLQLLLSVLLIPRHNAEGLAIAILVAAIVLFIMNYTLVLRRFRLRIFDSALFVRVVGVSVSVAAVATLIRGLGLIPELLIFTLLYILLAWRANAMPHALKEILADVHTTTVRTLKGAISKRGPR